MITHKPPSSAYDFATPILGSKPGSCSRFRSFDPATGEAEAYLGFDVPACVTSVADVRCKTDPEKVLNFWASMRKRASKSRHASGGRGPNLQAFGRRAPKGGLGAPARPPFRDRSVFPPKEPQKGKSPGMETGLFQTGKRAGGLQASPSVNSTRVVPAGSGSPRHSSARFCRRTARRGTLALAHRGLRPGARDVEQGFSFLLGLGLFGGVQALRRERDELSATDARIFRRSEGRVPARRLWGRINRDAI